MSTASNGLFREKCCSRVQTDPKKHLVDLSLKMSGKEPDQAAVPKEATAPEEAAAPTVNGQIISVGGGCHCPV